MLEYPNTLCLSGVVICTDVGPTLTRDKTNLINDQQMIIMSSPIAHNTESYYLDQNIAPARHPESVKNLYKKTTNFVKVEHNVAYVKKAL